MLCPYCGNETTVYKTVTEKLVVYRFRRCVNNKYHCFKTMESIVPPKEIEEGTNGKKNK